MTHLRGRPAGKYHIPIDFGAIGSGASLQRPTIFLTASEK